MYDAGKIITGLVIFVGFLGIPVLYNTASGKANQKPEIVLPTGAKKCIEPTDYMRANHMKLLYDWREAVVRHDRRTYVATDGTKYNNVSLTNTKIEKPGDVSCLYCHEKKTFCDRCHNYTGVKTPYCWNCHVDPREGN